MTIHNIMIIIQCPRCGGKSNIDLFYRDNGGMHTICRECRDALFKQQRTYN